MANTTLDANVTQAPDPNVGSDTPTTPSLNVPPPRKKRTKTPEAELRAKLKAVTAERDMLYAKCDQLEQVCQRLNEQFKNCDEAYRQLKRVAQDRENFVKRAITTAAEAVQRMESMRA